jgi:serine-type D-Ala-D-Ala carboxypeptidase (penicillin-binding protein 5/6)
MDKRDKITALITLLIFTAFAGYFAYDTQTKINEAVLTEKIIIDTFSDIQIEGRSAFVFDLSSGQILFEKNPEAQLPLASLTKIMSALVANEQSPDNISIRTSDTLLEERGGGEIRSGEWWRLRDLIKYSLVSSANDGTQAIASALGSLNSGTEKTPEEQFVDKMNAKARSIGLQQTYFLNSHGLDVSETYAGSYGSAKDAAVLISYAYKNIPEIMDVTSYEKYSIQSLSGIHHNVDNTNAIIGDLPGLSASKTGFTDLAGGNLAIVFEAGPARPFVIVVLGSSKEGRFEDVKKIYKASLDYILKNYD